MTIELHKLHKQCGNKIVEFKNGRINGYTIISYSNYKPLEIIQDVSIPRPDKPLSFDDTYDLLYGTPTAPDFIKTLNV